MVILETVYAVINKTLCCTNCTKVLEKYIAEDRKEVFKFEKHNDISEDKNDPNISDSATIVKLIIEERNNDSSEIKLKTTSSTNTCKNSSKTSRNHKNLERCKYCQQQQQCTEKENNWNIIIITDKCCSSLSSEPYISSGIDIKDSKVICCKAESTRLCAQSLQLPSTSSGNCNCRTFNSSHTSYMPYKEKNTNNKKNKNRFCSSTVKTDKGTSKPSSFVTFLRRCFHKNK